jgi:hypothetical protein
MVTSPGRSSCTYKCLVVAEEACLGVAAETHWFITSIAVSTRVVGVCAVFDDRIMIVVVEVCVASDGAERSVSFVIAEECVCIVLAEKCVSIAVGLIVTEERIARESVISSVGESGVVLVRVACSVLGFEARRVVVSVAVGLIVTEGRIARESVISSVGESGVVLVGVACSVLGFEARRVVVSVAIGMLAGVDGGVGVSEIVRKYDSTECKEDQH